MKLKKGDLLTNDCIEPRTRTVVSVDGSKVLLVVTNKRDSVPSCVDMETIDMYWRKAKNNE